MFSLGRDSFSLSSFDFEIFTPLRSQLNWQVLGQPCWASQASLRPVGYCHRHSVITASFGQWFLPGMSTITDCELHGNKSCIILITPATSITSWSAWHKWALSKWSFSEQFYPPPNPGKYVKFGNLQILCVIKWKCNSSTPIVTQIWHVKELHLQLRLLLKLHNWRGGNLQPLLVPALTICFLPILVPLNKVFSYFVDYRNRE